jgi:hypothetical protein
MFYLFSLNKEKIDITKIYENNIFFRKFYKKNEKLMVIYDLTYFYSENVMEIILQNANN